MVMATARRRSTRPILAAMPPFIFLLKLSIVIWSPFGQVADKSHMET
jgi:hypothetical protein